MLLLILLYVSLCHANSADPYQMPRSAVCDLGLHCLPICWDARHIFMGQSENMLLREV